MTDFKPIRIYNMVYTLAMKVIVNWLKFLNMRLVQRVKALSSGKAYYQ